ncbi:hypothetical protein [Bradyrhizobium japonicum]|uniref:hypothetical protein n=1 Tax=Bradyrhizobium japonicum TaxID=375 RepID=UPI0003F61D34|nr:hypothetical protein [Bradyrhizobium japonicum]
MKRKRSSPASMAGACASAIGAAGPRPKAALQKEQQRGNREAKKPKKEKTKVIAAAPSRKEAAWQPDFGPAKKK